MQCPAAVSEQLRAEHLKPEGDRRPINGEETGGVKSAVQRIRPSDAHASDRRRVVQVAILMSGQVPKTQYSCQSDDHGNQQPGTATIQSAAGLASLVPSVSQESRRLAVVAAGRPVGGVIQVDAVAVLSHHVSSAAVTKARSAQS